MSELFCAVNIQTWDAHEVQFGSPTPLKLVRQKENPTRSRYSLHNTIRGEEPVELAG